ncbi:MAG: polyhydroxyalkanoate granule-associated phasin [Caldimonas sp.]
MTQIGVLRLGRGSVSFPGRPVPKAYSGGRQRKGGMATSRRRSTPSLAVKAAELAFAVPQVVAHRVTRMALAGPRLSARDRKEFELMVAEKNAAFGEAWNAMAAHSAVANEALATELFRSFLAMTRGKKPSAAASAALLHKAALGVLGKGLAPVHRKAVANARRLARTKLR